MWFRATPSLSALGPALSMWALSVMSPQLMGDGKRVSVHLLLTGECRLRSRCLNWVQVFLTLSLLTPSEFTW